MARLIDLTGSVFGRLTVIRFHGRERNNYFWVCRCACDGSESKVNRSNLKNGHVQSCGCLLRETLIKRNTKHGHFGSGSYNSWAHMKSRCSNPNHIGFSDYGARGITFDQRWATFENFFDDMGERPRGATLDRIKNDQPYSKDNCRWSNAVTQANNKRNNLLISFNGRIQTLGQWVRELRAPYHLLYSRLVKLQWSPEKSFKEFYDKV